MIFVMRQFFQRSFTELFKYKYFRKFLAVIVLFVASSRSSADEIGKYFKNLSQAKRAELAAELKVTPDRGEAAGVSMVDILNRDCGFLGTYTKDQRGHILKPKVVCQYHADTDRDLDGGTPKFYCEFPIQSENSKVLKVKYAYSLDHSGKEIAPAGAVSLMAKLLGFKTDTFCPAEVFCDGCAPDPWGDGPNGQDRSSEPARVGAKAKFKLSVVEIKLPGWKLSVPRNGARKPLGFEWEEMWNLPKNLSELDKKKELTERKAYMLWINLLNHTDADAHNNRLICEEIKTPLVDMEKPICLRVAGYVHDYGDALNRMKLNSFSIKPIFLSSGFDWSHPFDSLSAKKGSCIGALSGGEGAIRHAEYFEADRLSLLNKLDQLSEVQLVEIFDLIEVEKVDPDSTAQSWAQVFMKKKEELKNSRCRL